jgi:hypothetical protein
MYEILFLSAPATGADAHVIDAQSAPSLLAARRIAREWVQSDIDSGLKRAQMLFAEILKDGVRVRNGKVIWLRPR